MGIDPEVREYVDNRVPVLLEEFHSTFRQECHEKCGELFARMAASERDRISINTRLDADRRLLEVTLASLNEKLDRLTRAVDGNGNGSMVTRLVVVEKDVDSLKANVQTKAHNNVSWHQVIAQGVVPVLLSWVGIGILYLAYLAFFHLGQKI